MHEAKNSDSFTNMLFLDRVLGIDSTQVFDQIGKPLFQVRKVKLLGFTKVDHFSSRSSQASDGLRRSKCQLKFCDRLDGHLANKIKKMDREIAHLIPRPLDLL